MAPGQVVDLLTASASAPRREDERFRDVQSGKERISTIMEVTEYQDLGVVGDVSLRFLDERLFQACFFPRSSEQYLKRLREQDGVSPERGVSTKADGAEISLSEPLSGGALGVCWSDPQLSEEFDRAVT
jgi:hypothetical protein